MTIFRYLEKHDISWLGFDDQKIYIYILWEDDDKTENLWKLATSTNAIYHDTTSNLPPNTTEPCAKSIRIYCFDNDNHTNNNVTIYHKIRILIYCNSGPILLFSEKHDIVKSLYHKHTIR